MLRIVSTEHQHLAGAHQWRQASYGPSAAEMPRGLCAVALCPPKLNSVNVGGSAIAPASAARNCAVDRRIAEPIGVTDVRVQ